MEGPYDDDVFAESWAKPTASARCGGSSRKNSAGSSPPPSSSASSSRPFLLLSCSSFRASLAGSTPRVRSSSRAATGSEHAVRAFRSSLARSVCTSCPKPTITRFTSGHRSRGIHASMAARVCSGVLVALGPVQPSWLHTLCTCVSTAMPAQTPVLTRSTMSAILGPTPGSAQSPSTVSGTRPACSSRMRRVVSLMYLSLLLWKPTLRMRSWNASSGVARTFSTVSPCARSRAIVSAVTVSLVCDESMSETSVW
mmetsp:Transcript_10572/g.42728  ORF Transcript_10572/g.42728 Transcript_10572/m.42728 type:complete len:254 (+) Transcript_10572:587-1348(+)